MSRERTRRDAAARGSADDGPATRRSTDGGREVQRGTDGHGSRRGADGGRLARRPFLGSLGSVAAAGVLAGCGSGDGGSGGGDGGVPDEWPSVDDEYYQSLVDSLSGQGLPPASFVYADDEAGTLAAYELLSDYGEASDLEVGDDVPFSEAVRLEIGAGVEQPWDATFKGDVTDHPVSQGDVLLGVLYARSPSGGATGGGASAIQYVAKDEPHIETNAVRNESQPSLGPEWTRYNFQVEFGYDSGEWWTEVFAGFGEQVVDLGGIALLDFGDQVAYQALPSWDPSYGYAGRADDADWRAAARERIDEHRTAPLSVSVVDGDGEPVEGAEVEVAMREHAFRFGSAVSVPAAAGDSTRTDDYREHFLELFDWATLENALKVPAWDGRWGDGFSAENRGEAVDWLDSNGVPIRGHTLVWGTYDHMGIDPSASPEEAQSAVLESIEERATAMRGDVVEWDLHNHPVMFPELGEDLGDERILEWWATAEETVPETPLYVNEGGVLPVGRGNRDPYREHVAWLTDEGAPVDGIGFMGHFTLADLRPPADLLEVFDEFAEFDRPLLVTEFDVDVDDRTDDDQVAVQRDYVRDFTLAAFSHESVEGIVAWGFDPESHWRRNAAYFDPDWSLRPHGEAFRDLVYGEWWTEESGETDGDGTFETDGFLGTYEVSVAADGDSTTTEATLAEDGTAVEVALDGA